MRLSISSFFSQYINHPLSSELSRTEKVEATVASIALGILSLGIAQLYYASKARHPASTIAGRARVLTPATFFSKYIRHPLAPELSRKEKIEATISSIALGIVTVGIAQIVSVIWARSKKRPVFSPAVPWVPKRFGTHAKPQSVLPREVLIPLFSYSPPSPSEKSIFPSGKVGFETIGATLQSSFIAPLYAKPLPAPDEVVVPLAKGGMVRWMSLTEDQKIDVSNSRTPANNCVKKTEWGKEHIDSLFMPGGQEPFLPNDPREYYGSDRALRMALFTPIFAYLYAKYDPNVQNISKDEVILSQMVAAGCDCARQTQGANVYHEESAQKTIEALKAAGCEDPAVFNDVQSAISEMDSPPEEKKPLLAKLVQNADCLESSQILLQSPAQNEAEFRKSEQYLDIYKELHEIAFKHKQRLKGDLTWTDFQEELEMVRWEMNRLIIETHQKEFRENASQSGESYYQEIVSKINEESYPHLFGILRHMGVVTESPRQKEGIEENKLQSTLSWIESWIKQGVETVPTSILEGSEEFLKSPLVPKEKKDLRKRVSQELGIRETAQQEFDSLLKADKEQNVERIGEAFAHLPYLLKQEYRPFLQAYFPYMGSLRDDSTALQTLRIEFLYKELCVLLEASPPADPLIRASQLRSKAEVLLKMDVLLKKEMRDPRIQTACALAFDEAAAAFLALNEKKHAKEVLKIAADQLDASLMPGLLRSWDSLGEKLEENEVCFFSSDCHRVRKRCLRMCEKVIDSTPYTELSCELTTKSRAGLEEALNLLGVSQISEVPALYPRRVSGRNAYSTEKDPMMIGKDFKITIADGVEIYIGAEKRLWTQYHLMRIRVKKGTDLQAVQKALSTIGLPTLLLTPRPEDERNELLARIISFRFPTKLLPGDPTKDARKAYQALTKKEKEVVDKDVSEAREQYVGPNSIALAQPTLAKEAWKQGARALGTFVDADNINDAGMIVSSIMKHGFLSSEERFSRGILGTGCAPVYNYATGSGNQVFTRVLTKDQFDARYCLDNLAIIGKVFFILDLQAFERMPYSYLYDRGGIRNPNYAQRYFAPEKQEPIWDYKGAERVRERPGFPKIISDQVGRPHPLNETMFDLSLSAQYIQRVVVAEEEDRRALIRILKEKGIFEINGLPVEAAVVATNCLHPGMVNNFYESSYPSST